MLLLVWGYWVVICWWVGLLGLSSYGVLQKWMLLRFWFWVGLLVLVQRCEVVQIGRLLVYWKVRVGLIWWVCCGVVVRNMKLMFWWCDGWVVIWLLRVFCRCWVWFLFWCSCSRLVICCVSCIGWLICLVVIRLLFVDCQFWLKVVNMWLFYLLCGISVMVWCMLLFQVWLVIVCVLFLVVRLNWNSCVGFFWLLLLQLSVRVVIGSCLWLVSCLISGFFSGLMISLMLLVWVWWQKLFSECIWVLLQSLIEGGFWLVCWVWKWVVRKLFCRVWVMLVNCFCWGSRRVMWVSGCWDSVLSFFSVVGKCLVVGCLGFCCCQFLMLVCCCCRVGEVLVMCVRVSQLLRLFLLVFGCNWLIGRLLIRVQIFFWFLIIVGFLSSGVKQMCFLVVVRIWLLVVRVWVLVCWV